MRAAVRWAIEHTPAMNTFLVSILIVGLLAAFLLRREEFPRFDLEIILVQVPYPGASPDEVESGICQKIEEVVRSIDGVKKVNSVAMEGVGYVIIEVRSDAPSVERVLNQAEAEINRIPSFPELAEQPDIQQLTIRHSAITVGVVAEANQAANAEWKLRDMVEQVRDDLLLIPEVSVAEIQGERKYQIDVEISESTLHKYGLSLQEVARRLRLENLELPGGTIKDESREILLRGKNRRVRGRDIARLPLVTQPNGVVLTVGDLGTVRDEFDDKTSISRINGLPGMAISVEAAAREDLLAMTQAVRQYVAAKQLPSGYRFEVWGDRSIDVRDRLDLLRRNGLQGLVLVFLVLALFLELRLSFWVALGIPVSVLGACAVLWQMDQTLNMLSMFGFLITLGIVVDDGIVIGENIHAHRQMGKGFVRAAVDGTVEVIASVTTSVVTTIFAFVPMFFVTGVMGKFFAVLPLAVIAMLLISLLEAAFILPCHLAHDPARHPRRTWTRRVLDWRASRHDDDPSAWRSDGRAHRRRAVRWILATPVLPIALVADQLLYPLRRLGDALNWISQHFSRLLEFLIQRGYSPLLRLAMRRPVMVLSASVAFAIGSLSLVRNGTVPWVFFPKLDARLIEANIVFPDGTPSHVTDAATQRLEQAILAVNDRYRKEGQPVVELTYRLVGQVRSQSPGAADERTEGSNAGTVKVALVDNQQRSVTSQQIVDQWRRSVGDVPGAETVSFGSVAMGPGGKPIEFKLLADAEHMPQLEAAVDQCKAKLETYPGVIDIADDSRPGKWEIQLQLRDDAQALGVPLQAVAAKVRAAYYGEEVMRLQRGRHEVKLMVRYPEEERRSLARFQEIYIDAGDGVQRPITELADVNIARGYSEINRLNQRRSITVTADVDETQANAAQITADLRTSFMPQLLEKYPDIHVRWEGQQEQSTESIQSLFFGLVVALLAMFVLLTLEFNSYALPSIVMIMIPFGMIGALWGHAFMGLPLTLFSLLGMVALAGVVVNDSIVLIDFINARIKEGVPIREAIFQSGTRRFRPVILTSLTTIAGLLPIMLERSFQAQVLIPMVTSLCFGLACSTALVLIVVPALFTLYGRFVIGLDWREARYARPGPRHGDDGESIKPAAQVAEPVADNIEHARDRIESS